MLALTRGAHAMSGPDEETPSKRQTTLELIFEGLNEIKETLTTVANESCATREDMKQAFARIAALERQQAAHQAAHLWAPLIISSLAFAGTLWLAFKIGHG